MGEVQTDLRALRQSVADAAAAVDALRPAETSTHGRAGVLLGKALWRLLRPFAWRSRAAGEAVVAALEEMTACSQSLMLARATLEEELRRMAQRVEHVEREIDASPAWIIPRIRADGSVDDAVPLVIPRETLELSAPQRDWIRVDTDEGRLWAFGADRVIGQALLLEHTWEPEFTSVLMRHVKPGMAAIDVGANIGYVTRTLGRLVGPEGSVIALEPEPRNFALLCANTADIARVRRVRAAALDRTGDVTLWLGKENFGDHRTWASDAEAVQGVHVPCVRLDDLLDPGVHVDVVKVDTQGTDHLVVAGMERTIERWRPTIFVEFWPGGITGSGSDPHRILDYYRTLGFHLEVVDAPGHVFAGNDEIIALADDSRGRYVDLLLKPD